MGAIAEGMVAFAQPLIDRTDGSMEQMEKAMALGQLCWNLAVLPEDQGEKLLDELRPSFGMDDDEFNELRRNVIDPMIRRHHEMFPQMRRWGSTAEVPADPPPQASPKASGEPYPGAQPYGPCPCNSGRKYKFCCRSKRRGG